MHTSCLYLIEPQVRLAKLLTSTCDLTKVFFCNSGAEANETAIKIARKYAKQQGRLAATRIISTIGSFHGRTTGALAATGQAKYQEPFAPLIPGFVHVPYGDAQAVADLVDDTVCGVIVEPVQGESGVRVPPDGYLNGLRTLCDEHDAILIFDEVQTGLGRTGYWYGYMHDGAVPDVMTLAKSLGGGFPMGAALCNERANVLRPGDHASTFGGNHLACAAGLAAVTAMKEEGLVENSKRVGDYARRRFGELATAHPQICDVRGRGLMLGIEVSDGSAQALNRKLFEARYIANAIGDSVLRVLPPLTVTTEDVGGFVAALDGALG
jgi:acetylornithine/succinyldiaminopimelate/putrescine aminotransferase